MARSFSHSVLVDGKPVGFSLKRRPGDPFHFVCFRGPDGRRLERSTMQTGQAKALEAARSIITREHAPPDRPAELVPWDEAERRFLRRMELSGLRKNTLGYYAKMFGLVRTAYGSAHGPADITEGMAKSFVDMILAGRFHTSKKKRSPAYLFNALRGLDSLWEKWLMKECGVVAGNPWRDIPRPKLDKPHVVYLTDEQTADFFAYLEEQWLGWKLPRLFFTVKALTGCRLEDLCSIESGQLHGDKLVFRADQTKGRKERRVPIPAEVYAELEAVRGKTYLWDRFPDELREVLKARGIGSWKIVGRCYSPRMLYNWATQLLGRYSKKVGRRVTSHMFRKRAFTMAFLAGLDARKAAIAIGCNVDTMMKHYVSLDEQAVTDEVFAELQGRLIPRKK